MAIFVTIAGWFGISPFRLLAYASIAFAVLSAGLAIRHHYVMKGWDAALESVKKQDAVAKDAAAKVQATADQCKGQNGWWDVVTQACQGEAK